VVKTVGRGKAIPSLFSLGENMSKEAELLYEAFHSDFGIEVELLGNFQVSLQRLYAAKRKDPDLDILQISRSPTSPTHIWIVKTDRPQVKSTPPVGETLKENPRGDGPLYNLADLLGDD
jgi:hypothetical protein